MAIVDASGQTNEGAERPAPHRASSDVSIFRDVSQPGFLLVEPDARDASQHLDLPKQRQELTATTDYLQRRIEEHDRITNDLGSANEALTARNKELQSVNRELETAKEKLQTINAELTTVNDRLRHRNREVGVVNSDLIDALKHNLEKAEEAKALAERANQAKDDFLATLSHELRTPLTTVLLQTQRLQRGHHDAQQIKAITRSIEQGTSLQLRLIDDLLDVSGIVAGKMEMALEEVDLAQVLKGAVEAASMPAEAKPVKLTLMIEKSLGPIRGNSTRLHQVASNLLNNAVKFTPAGGEVKVVLDRVEGQALLQVSDNGRGIESAALPHVFERFFQEDRAATNSFRGLGLGLAIARHLVELHGGTIWAESAGTGQGATFSVRLPIEPTCSDG